MKKVLLPFLSTILFLCSFFIVNAQVYNGNIKLTTQAQVDAFSYSEVTGTIQVFGSDITNLNGMSELTKAGSLEIVNNPRLTSLIGLANLEDVDGTLSITFNRSLTHLDGFSSLTTIGGVTSGGLEIIDNAVLANVNGLFNLNYTRGLTIRKNPALVDIDGLYNLDGLGFGDLIIDNNDALTNLDGLSKIGITINGNVKIVDNQNLGNIDGLSQVVTVGDNVLIQGNASLTTINLTKLEYLIQGSISIANNPLLQNLDGLSSLDNIGSLFIGNNAMLNNIDGLSKLRTLRGSITISDNNLLLNIDALSGLEHIYGNLYILNNAVLTNIDGLKNITTIGDNLKIANNGALTNLDGLAKLYWLGDNLEITDNVNLTDYCGLAKLFGPTGKIEGTITISGNGAGTVVVSSPANITINADAGLCSAVVSNGAIGTATVTGCLKPSAPGNSGIPVGNIFPVGVTTITWIATDATGTLSTASQTITVVDNQLPSITAPTNVVVQCAADVPAVNINAVTASDNCNGVTVTHVSDVISNQTCVNRYVLTRTYKATDKAGNTATATQTITVNDNIAPQIIGLSTSKQLLAPPNHKLQDITVNYNVLDNCNSSPVYTFNVTSSEPVNGVGDGNTDPDWEIIDDHHIRLRAERAAAGNGRIYTITVTANDGCNATVTSTAQVAVVHNITSPHSGNAFKVGSTVALNGEFWDVPVNKHTAKWLIDGSTTVKGTVTEPSGNKNGKVTGSYKFTAPGVYKLQMNITDQNGVTTYANTNGDLDAIVVIYDPNGGHTYGGGYFNSPAGALTSNPGATGKANYGFATNYFKNSTYPKGETQFELKVGDFEYNALSFDYLSISGAKAQFKGTGKIIGGQSGVNFIMTVVDGQLDGSGVDKIRMKIYNKNTGQVYYDNQPGAGDAADPVAAVGANSTVVIGSNALMTSTNRQEPEKGLVEVMDDGLQLKVFPNPTTVNFTLSVNSNNRTERMIMQVINVHGQIIETRTVTNNQTISFGERYRPGAYYVRIIQGDQQKQARLIKLK